MRSFARVVQCYADAHGIGAQSDQRRKLAQTAASDLYEIFTTQNWRAFERQVDVALWATQTLTLTSVSGTLARFSETADAKWVGQDLILSGSTTPHLIVRINDTNSLIFDPAYTGASIASGTAATIRQVRIGLPSGFGAILDPVLRDHQESRPTSPHELTQIMRGQWASGFCHTIQGSDMIIWPVQAGRLYFRYRYAPDSPFEYGSPDNQAMVNTQEPDTVIGSGTFWTQIPDNGSGTVFESDESIARGMPVSHSIIKIQDDDMLVLESDWKSPLDTLFNYHISTDLDLPNYLAQCVRAKAEWRAGKRDQSHFYQCLLRAAAADAAIDQRFNRVAQSSMVALVTGSRT